ncbi:MAG TPA: universal stress protein [Prosthecobacter sp.]|nr:universal stress protein [Prosthecobacter sp.]
MKTPATPDLWQKILVPTDFSECSAAAVHAAAALHQKTGAEILLLHVTEPAYQGLRVQTSGLHAQMREEAENSLTKLAAEVFPNATRVRTLVRDGRPAEMICQTVAEEAADAVIIPTHGHSGLKHALLGSVTEKVVRHAPCSVLVVRE